MTLTSWISNFETDCGEIEVRVASEAGSAFYVPFSIYPKSPRSKRRLSVENTAMSHLVEKCGSRRLQEEFEI